MVLSWGKNHIHMLLSAPSPTVWHEYSAKCFRRHRFHDWENCHWTLHFQNGDLHVTSPYNIHTCPAHRLWEYSNSSSESYFDLMPNSHNWFTQECVATRGRINNWILGVKGLINISNDELEKIEINKLFNFSLPYLYNINQISVEKKNINLG